MTASKKAVVAMSGGVDSSVAAAVMVEQGYDVTGIMLKLWRGEAANTNSGCCNLGAAEDARRVADVLGIPFYVLNFADRFESSVIRNFENEYASGATPNPCVRCNQWIKFDALLDRARGLDADVLVTGHYARVRQRDGIYRLMRAVDVAKDQSYVLWMLSQDQLAACRFPIGEMHKSDTRAMAAELGLRTAQKPDSQEICFVKDGNLGNYIASHVPQASKPGVIRDTQGRRLGEHRGVGRYTIGQRKGLGISLGVPVYVKDIDPSDNSVVVSSREDLQVSALVLDEVSFVASSLQAGDRVLVQHRAHGEASPATVVGTSAEGALEVRYAEPVEAVAPGQSAVLYSPDHPDELLGGGIVSQTKAAARAPVAT
jgi:tRNA-uridine 2-sulfurtransferase